MKYLVNRLEIVKDKIIIKSILAKIQQDNFEEEILNECDTDEEKKEYVEMFDFINIDISNSKCIDKIIGINPKHEETFTTDLNYKLIELFNSINVEELYILSDLKKDIFGNRSNNYIPLKNAYKRLEKVVNRSTYTEGFKIDLKDLNIFIDIFFWIVRCDPSISQQILFFDKDEKFYFSVCKYGNIHLTEFGVETITKELLLSKGWKIIEDEETDEFIN